MDVENSASKYKLSGGLTWLPARGPELSQHKWGELCVNEDGDEFLIGDATEDNNYDDGCGCCAERASASPIVTYAVVITCDGVDDSASGEGE